MAKTPSEYLAAVQRMTCCTQYPERGDPYGSLEVEPDGGLVRASDFVAAIEAAQAEARAEERGRIWSEQAEVLDSLFERVGQDGDAYLGALEVLCRVYGDKVPTGDQDERPPPWPDRDPEPGWGDQAVDEARAEVAKEAIAVRPQQRRVLDAAVAYVQAPFRPNWDMEEDELLGEELNEAVQAYVRIVNGWREPGPAGEEG